MLAPETNAYLEYISFGVALWGALLGHRGQDEADIVECHDAVLDALVDADRTRTVECLTERNWRDQVSLEQAEQLHREREAARHWQQKN